MAEYTRPKTEVKKAILFVLLCAIANAFQAFFAKKAAHHIAVSYVLLSRCVFVFIFLIITMLFQKRLTFEHTFKTKRIFLHLFRDISGLLGLYTYFLAAKFLNLSTAVVLYNATPLILPLVAYFWSGIKIFHRIWWGLGLGYVGILFIIQPGEDVTSAYALIGFLSALFASFAFIAGRRLLYTESPQKVMFYYFSISLVISFIFILFDIQGFKLIRGPVLIDLILVGVFGYLFQVFLTLTLKHAPVRFTSPFLYFSVVVSLFLDAFILNNYPDVYSWIGIFLIVFGAILSILIYPKNDYEKVNKSS